MFFFLTLMILGINSVTAQNHIGKWVADQEISKLINNDPTMDIALGLVFTAKDINIQFNIKAQDDEMTMKMLCTLPGTYTKSGKNVVAKYAPEKLTLKIIDVKTNDAEINEMLASKEGREMVFKMIEDQAISEMKKQINELDEIINLFGNFTMEKVTATKLILGMSDTTISFDRSN